tara:strand:+ start:53091 stop:54431 length:1341 start_codon:yes stop_codon:yes gene_type:complete
MRAGRSPSVWAALGFVLALHPTWVQAKTSEAKPDAEAADRPSTVEKTKKKKKRKKRKKRTAIKRWVIETDASVDTKAGYFSGDATLQTPGAFEEIGASVRPQVEHKQWRLQVPVQASDRRTISASLNETQGSAGARLRYKKSRALNVTLRGDLSGRWREGWPDQYQPLPDGGLSPTDRNSRWQRSAGLDVASVLLKKHHLKGAYQYELVDYREDPTFNPIDAPTHVVPGDRGEHTLELSWMHWGKATKLGGGLDVRHRESFFAYSRDAKDGQTHAASGGLPPNPLQVMVEVEPYLAWEYGRLKDRWQLDVYYGVEIVSDRFEGYYSSVAQHPKVDLTIKTSQSGKAKAGAEVYWRRYGANSYAEGARHPPLSFGDRRVERRFLADVSYQHELGRSWSLVAEGSVSVKRTNFPDYVPMVFPSGREYDIRWNYTNFAASIGLEWHVAD